MNRSLVLLACVLAATCVGVQAGSNEMATFREFATTYGKKYASVEAEQKAFATFRTNLQVMEQHRRANPHATFGVTQFSDMTPEEFETTLRFRGFSVEPDSSHERPAPTPSPNPKQWDWRTMGGVTRVLDQGTCGSCAAYSAVANAEGVCFSQSGNLVELSVHQIECGMESPCQGFTQEMAYSYIIKDLNGHMATAASFPQSYNCSMRPVTGCTVTSYNRIPSDEVLMAVYVYRNGPVSIGVNALQWQFYRGGILTKCGVVTHVNHAATIVGYNYDAPIPYWVLKNSWGPAWGERGFINLSMGNNTCGIKVTPYTVYIEENTRRVLSRM